MLNFGETSLEPIALPDAELLFQPHCDLGFGHDALFERLLAETTWREESITVFGRTHLQPRLVAWYGDPGASYTYSGIQHEPLPWTETLEALRDHVGEVTDAPYNSVLLNLYLSTSTFPSCWKYGYVQPVPKKGDCANLT